MATPISDEELQLKKRARRRLIGAIALVTVVAVFLPMVLDHEPRPVNQDINIQIPAQNAGTFTSKIVPVVPGGAETKAEPAVDANAVPATAVPPAAVDASKAPAVAAKAEPAKVAPAAPAPPVKDSEVAPPKVAVVDPKAAASEAKARPKMPPASTDSEAAPEKAPASDAATKPKAKPEPKADAKPKSAKAAKAGEGGAFVVQIAALNDADKAGQMRDQIAAAGVKSYTEAVPTAKGNVTRVRAGPFATRAAAEKARDKLKELGLAGNVVAK